MRTLSVEELSRRLDQRFELLTEGSRTALPRHRTLRALIDWSYDLLSDAEKAHAATRVRVLGRVDVGSGRARVLRRRSSNARKALDLLTSLVDKNLFVAETYDGR